MKKFLKNFFIIILILIVLYLVHSLITAKVYFDIYTAMKEKVETEDTFYAKNISNSEYNNFSVELEVFIKDNVFVKKLTHINENNERELSFKVWQKYLPNKSEDEDGKGYMFVDSETDKNVSILEYNPIVIEPENKMYRYNIVLSHILGEGLINTFFEPSNIKEYTYSTMLSDVLKSPTILYSTSYNGEECYAIKQFLVLNGNDFMYNADASNFEILTATYVQYISKKTKLPIGTTSSKILSGKQDKTEYFTREVTDEDIKLSDLKEYRILEN